jgi:hypothetical protein
MDAFRRKPAPAVVLAALALVFAIVGSAVAGTAGLSSKITKAKVRSIAAKQADRRITARAPGLSVDRARTADTAQTAATTQTAANAQNLGGRPGGDYALAESEPFHTVGLAGEPPFENGWANLGGGRSAAAFYRDSQGLVHLKGVLSGTTATTAFTLPAGYRPTEQLFMPVAVAAGGDGDGGLNVHPDGRIVPVCSPTCAAVGIDGLSFRLP